MTQEYMLQNVIGNILRLVKERLFERPNWCQFVQYWFNFGRLDLNLFYNSHVNAPTNSFGMFNDHEQKIK